jgi:hypothetical protein
VSDRDGDGIDIDESMNVTIVGFIYTDIQDDGIDVDPSQNIVFDHGLIMNVGDDGVVVAGNGTDDVFILNTTIDGTGGDGIDVIAPLTYDDQASAPFMFDDNANVFIGNVTFANIGSGTDINGTDVNP